MRELRDIVSKIITAIEDIEVPIKAIHEFPNDMMDLPLSQALVSVGVENINIDSLPASTYGGKRGNVEEFSLPADVVAKISVHIPTNYNGYIAYDAASLIMDAVAKSDIGVYKIKTEKMYYDSTFLCVVFPIFIYFRTRICGNSV